MSESDLLRYETPSDSYSGEYRNMLNLLISNTWFGILYVVVSVLLIYGLGYLSSPIILFVSVIVPTLVATFYVLFPNKQIIYKLVFNWISTAFIVIVIYLYQYAPDQYSKNEMSFYLGLLCWFYIIYWLALSITWNISIVRNLKLQSNINVLWETISKVMIIWGATLQICYFFIWFVVPFLKDIDPVSSTLNFFINFVEILYNLSLTRYFPQGLIFLGFLLLASLKFKTNPYNPIAMDEVFRTAKNSLITIIIQSVRLPVWLVVIIIGFIGHFTKLLIESVLEIFNSYLARLTYLVFSVLVSPILFLVGHAFILLSISKLSFYLREDSQLSLENVLVFLVVNLGFIMGLCFYVLASPILRLKYKGEKLKNLISSVIIELKTSGKDIATAVGRTFSLFGLLAFVIPVSTLMPGGPNFGTFSIIYSFSIVVILFYYSYKKWMGGQ